MGKEEMKENNNEINIIKEHQRKRRRHKVRLAVSSVIMLLIALILIGTYSVVSQNEYNQYTEQAKVDYKVNLKENEFYQKSSLDEKSAVIASLIQNIEIQFNYNFNLSQEQDYTYNYNIVAKTNVKESKKDNVIYETTEELLSKPAQASNSKNLNILEKLTIDYNEYNDKISKFINVYGLNDTTSTLELSMYVNIINKYDGTQVNKDNKVMTISIPLTTKTVDVRISSNVIKDTGNMLIKKSEFENAQYLFVAGVISAVAGLVLVAKFVKYILDTRSAETMYAQELKQILFSYKSYIQKSNNEISKKGYKVIQINTFNEILGLRDTMQTPILMYTSEEELSTEFIIISDKILYVYVLSAKEIRNELRAKSAEMKKRKQK